MNEHHYHLHDDTGMCYGDTRNFDTAALIAEEGWLVVIDAPHCIQDCREEN
jgi:hypothetical protein